MSEAIRNQIRRDVLKYIRENASAVSLGDVTNAVRQKHATVRDSDVRSVVQPMIATGTLDFAPGLKIKLGADS
jgi:hypothetical protein